MILTLPTPHGKQHPHNKTESTALFRIGRATLIVLVLSMFSAVASFAGGPVEPQPFKVLPPVVRGNLALFPVVADHSYDASQLMTLDEGIRNGQVTVTEAGDQRGLVRPGQSLPPRSGAEVNRLVLNNNSSRPLLLLAGEIVTGGKQDRVTSGLGKSRPGTCERLVTLDAHSASTFQDWTRRVSR